MVLIRSLEGHQLFGEKSGIYNPDIEHIVPCLTDKALIRDEAIPNFFNSISSRSRFNLSKVLEELVEMTSIWFSYWLLVTVNRPAFNTYCSGIITFFSWNVKYLIDIICFYRIFRVYYEVTRSTSILWQVASRKIFYCPLRSFQEQTTKSYYKRQTQHIILDIFGIPVLKRNLLSICIKFLNLLSMEN